MSHAKPYTVSVGYITNPLFLKASTAIEISLGFGLSGCIRNNIKQINELQM
jgi:hypothetical protein